MEREIESRQGKGVVAFLDDVLPQCEVTSVAAFEQENVVRCEADEHEADGDVLADRNCEKVVTIFFYTHEHMFEFRSD
jgi:hypothetical protein